MACRIKSGETLYVQFAVLALWLCVPPYLRAQSPPDTTAATSLESYIRTANAAREAGNMDLAVHDYQEALKLQPAWQEGWWNVGTIEYERDHYAGAIPAFRMLARLAPEASPAWTFLGLCEFGTKDYFYALAHLSKGESLGGARDAQIARVAKYHLGLLLIRSGDFDKATALLSALASTGEVSPQIKFALGLYLLRVPLLPDEIDSSKEALVQDAGDIAAELAAGDLSAAMNAFKIAIAKYPDAPGLHRAFGEALARDGKTKDAQAEFRRETQVSRPAIADRIVQWYGTSPRADRPSTDETSSGGALFDAAMQDYSAKQFPEAIAALKIWLQQNANSGTAWAVLGLSEFAQRDYDNALIHLRRGQQLGMSGSPESVALANYRLGVLLNHSGQFSAAEQLLMPARASEPLGSEIKFALGMSVLHITEFSEQVPASQRALVTGAGEIAALLGDSKYDLAFSRLDELLKKYPSTPFLHYTYGTALGSISQYEEAAKQFREELALSPSSELPYLGLASLELKRHRAADALEPAQRAVQLAPRNSTAHYLLGRSYLETGKTTEALAELRQASAITPNSPEVHFSLAKAYAKANQPEKAEEERTIFAQLNILKERQRGQQGDQSYGAHEATNADISGVDRAGTEAGKPR